MYYLKENCTGKKAIYETSLDILKTEENIVFSFVAKHCSFNSYSDKFNDNLFSGDALEVFIDRNEDNHYLEIEVAPNGTLFIANIDYNDGVNRHIHYLPNKGVAALINKKDDELHCKLIIDREVFNLKDNLKFNAYRIETDGTTPEKHLFALNPTLIFNFHVPNKFISL